MSQGKNNQQKNNQQNNNQQINIKKDLFENTPVTRALAQVAIPTVISQLVQLIYNVADTFFIGRTGNPYMVAAVSLAFTLFIMQIPVANLFGIGGGGLISRLLGQGEYERAKSVSAFSFYWSLVFSAAFALVIFIFLDPILYGLGASENTIVYARQYMILVVILGAVPTIVSQAMSHVLRNAGYSRQASLGLSGGGVLNMILDPLFMFVIFPGDMAVVGAAAATLLSNVIAMIYFILTINKASKTSALSLKLSDALKVKKLDVKETFAVGVPAAILPGLYDLTNMLLNSRMAFHGDLQLAAIGIVLKVERLPSSIGLGISQGMLPLIGYNFTSGNHRRMKEVIKKARIAGLATSAFAIVLYMVFARPISGAFLNAKGAEEAAIVLDYATTFLRIRAVMSPFMFLNYHSSYCLQAMGDGRDTLIHSVIRQLVFNIPLLFIMDHFLQETGACMSMVVGECLSCMLAIGLLRAWLKKVEKKAAISYN